MKFLSSTLGLAIGLAVAGLGDVVSAAWDKNAKNNIAIYWGQNAFGSYNNDTTLHQQGLLNYCQDTNVDVRLILHNLLTSGLKTLTFIIGYSRRFLEYLEEHW